MGIKQTDRRGFEPGDDLALLLAQESVIAADFDMSFDVLEGYPQITVEQRPHEAPQFLGFWVFGDGPGVTLAEQAEVEFELLHNAALGANGHTQISLTTRVTDKRYKSDYAGYYLSQGKQLKNIRKRFELLAGRAVLDLHRFVLAAKDEGQWDVMQMFSSSQLKLLFKEMRVPRRFNGPLR